MATANVISARKKLLYIIQELINNVEDDKILEIYDTVSDGEIFEYSDEVKARIEQVRDDYASGRTEKFLTESRFHQRLQQIRDRK